MSDVTRMTREERQAWLAEVKPRYDLELVIRGHYHLPSRPWPDGTPPTAPDWNPGCFCGEAMYFFDHAAHLADVILAEGWSR